MFFCSVKNESSHIVNILDTTTLEILDSIRFLTNYENQTSHNVWSPKCHNFFKDGRFSPTMRFIIARLRFVRRSYFASSGFTFVVSIQHHQCGYMSSTCSELYARVMSIHKVSLVITKTVVTGIQLCVRGLNTASPVRLQQEACIS